MKKRIVSLFLVLLLTASIIPMIPLFEAAAVSNKEIGVITGGGFETPSFWADGRTKSNDAFEGDYVVAAPNSTSTRYYSNQLTLESNTDYTLSFWYLNPEMDSSDQFGLFVNTTLYKSVTLTQSNTWVYATLEFNTKKYTSFRLGIRGNNLKIDGVSISYKTIGNSIENSSFEGSLSGWSDINDAYPAKLSSESCASGFVSASIPNGKDTGIFCDINVIANTKYELSFSYKGGGSDAFYGVARTRGEANTPSFITEKMTFENTDEWKNVSLYFDSGNRLEVRIVFGLGTTGSLMLDDICVKRDENYNLVKNSGFEDGKDNWTNVKDSQIISGMSNTGNNSAQLVQSTYGKMYQQVEVTPNTDYILAFNRRNGDWSQWAICDGSLKTPVVNKGEKGFIVGGNMSGSTGAWTSETGTFNSGSNTSIFIVYQSASATCPVLIDDVYLTSKTKTADDDLIISNGSFEEGLENWEQSWLGAVALSNDSYTGTYALQMLQNPSYPKVGHAFSVEAGKSYVALFNYKGNCQYTKWSVSSKGTKYAVEPSASAFVVGGTLTSNSDEWKSVRSDVFTATADDTYYFNFQSNGNAGLSTVIDDVYVLELDGSSSVLNGDFAGTLAGWNCDKAYFELDKDSYSGSHSLHAYGGYHKTVNQIIAVEKNTKYALNFWYKGVMPKDISAFAVSVSTSFNDNCVLKGQLDDTEEWKEVKLGFNSGNNTVLYLLFQTMEDSEYCIDKVSVIKTDEDIPVGTEIKKALFLGTQSRNYYNDYPYVTDKEHNIISNYDFESTKNTGIGNTNNLANASASIINDSSVAYNGNNCLQFVAGGKEKTTTMKLPLKKNTTYWMSLFVKTTEYSGNDTYGSFGISEPDNGDFLVFADPNTEATRLYTTTVQMIPTAADNRWHLVTLSFETNDVDNLYFTVRGKNITLFFDDMYLFEEQYATRYISPMEDLTDVVITDDNPAKLGVAEEKDNLFENSSVNSMSDYWCDTVGNVFGKSLDAKDSKHSIQGKALYYESAQKYPNRDYYIKWIDVKPNTEYTFSAKYCITSVGSGFVGLISGYKSSANSYSENAVYPTLIKKFSFSKDSFDENCNWQNIAVSFNTNDRNRIGFVVFNGGGTAYIDDLKLFKSSNGVVQVEPVDNFPKTIVSNNENYKISGGRATGIPIGTKLSTLISSLKNSKYIRVFDISGKEIKDMNKEVSTGIQIRLMDGPTIKDRADIILRGDVNGDGLNNSADISLILDHLSRKSVLTNLFLEAADYDGDAEVTVHDLAFIHKLPTYGDAKATLSGPDTFNPGDEINVQLSFDTNSLLAISGTLEFDESALTPIGVYSDNGELLISQLNSGSEFWFSAYAPNKCSGKNIVYFKFKVLNITEYSQAYVKLKQAYATTGSDMLVAPSFTWAKETVTGNIEEQIKYIEETETIYAKNKLSMLKLDEAEIVPDFDPDIKEYTATVPFKVDKVTVTAIAADPDAVVTIGKTNLKYVGRNNVKVQVVSADGLKRTYKIVVTRKPPVKSAISDSLSTLAIVAICVGALLVLATATFFIIFFIKRKKKNEN